MTELNLRLIGSCPSIGNASTGKGYLLNVEHAAKCADQNGWDSILIYADHRQADPWLIAQVVIQATSQLKPLVALQPLYAHPFTIAKSIATIAYIYGRQVRLNMIAGGSPLDLESFCDSVPHDRRYNRIVEYATIVRDLFCELGLVSSAGEFYQVRNLQLLPRLQPDLWPTFMISGSSAAGLEAATRIGAIAVQYLRPAGELTTFGFNKRLQHATRLGIIARESHESAWLAALKRYPEDQDRARLRQVATNVSDSVWVKELNRAIDVRVGHPYWLGPFKNYYAPCPFLVGSCNEVIAELVEYIGLGIRTFLLVQPEDEEDYGRVNEIFRAAQAQAISRGASKLNDAVQSGSVPQGLPSQF